MASSSVIAKRYFEALADRDLDAASGHWAPDATDLVSVRFGELFDAFPDLQIELIDTITQSGRCVVRWRATGTFIGPGRIQGFAPNGGRIAIEGCDVVEVRDDQIVSDDSYLDGADVIRQLGLIPAPRSVTALANTRTWLRNDALRRRAGGDRRRRLDAARRSGEAHERLPDRGRGRRDRLRRGLGADDRRDPRRRCAVRRDPAGGSRPRRLRSIAAAPPASMRRSTAIRWSARRPKRRRPTVTTGT